MDRNQLLDTVSTPLVSCGYQELTAATCRTFPSAESNGNTGVSGFYPPSFLTWTMQVENLWTAGTLLEVSRRCQWTHALLS